MSGEQTDFDPYAIVLADLYKRQAEIGSAIRAIEGLRGTNINPTQTDVSRAPTPSGDNERGDFLGLSIAEASKKFLSLRRKTLNSSEIADGLTAAGYPMTASDPGNVVGSVLTRRFNSVGDIVRVSRGQWGLAEWYPNRSFRRKLLQEKLTQPNATSLVDDGS